MDPTYLKTICYLTENKMSFGGLFLDDKKVSIHNQYNTHSLSLLYWEHMLELWEHKIAVYWHYWLLLSLYYE